MEIFEINRPSVFLIALLQNFIGDSFDLTVGNGSAFVKKFHSLNEIISGKHSISVEIEDFEHEFGLLDDGGLGRKDTESFDEEGEVNVEQFWLLKGSMYVGLFFFFTGGYELFMATVLFIWLLLEANLS